MDAIKWITQSIQQQSTRGNLLSVLVWGSSLIQFGIIHQITQRLSLSIWVTPVLEAGKSYDPSSLEIKLHKLP